MPVRQPTGKLRKGKKKLVKGPESRVRGIKTESGWENALKASDGRYLILHVLSDPASAPSVNFRMQFARLSSSKEYEHMLFAEASTSCSKALKDVVRKHGNGNFPLLLVFYRRKCIRSVKPDAPVPTSVLGGAFGGFFQAARAAIIELAKEAPKPGPWRKWLIRIAVLLVASGATSGFFVTRARQAHKESQAEAEAQAEDDSEVAEFDVRDAEDFAVDDDEDPLSLP
eukprot:jgi/Ulvmu1/8080/UM004_0317.1